MNYSVLIVPSVMKGNGSGHIVRSLSLARSLGAGAAVYAPESKTETLWSAAEISLAYARESQGVRILSRLPDPDLKASSWDLVVLDRRATSFDELRFWERFGPIVAIDEGGQARESAHYLIDILPRHPAALGSAANYSNIALLDLPLSRRKRPSAFKRVLVSFGGEDAAGLSLVLSRRLVAEGLVDPADLTIVSGALRRGAPPIGLDGVTMLGPVQDLKEHLHRYDLVLTQFGLTAFEAAWAGCGVVLFNPSRYHRELSVAAGFPEIGVLKPDMHALRRFLSSPEEVLSALESILPSEKESIADKITALIPAGPTNCPACSSFERRIVWRGADKSYFRCSSCGLLYMTSFGSVETPLRYSKSYFFEEYKRQYGRTYLEDWPELTKMADSRLKRIESIAAKSLGTSRQLSLVDIGCAYGPFLARARECGHEVRGLDVSEDAVAYVRGELGVFALVGDFLDQEVTSALGGPFDALSMWYVIEHFSDLDAALRNAASLIRPGGLLALSTPSAEGASALFARNKFFTESPRDHYSLWEPSRVRSLLRTYGFRVERIRITGHHPERLPGLRFLARYKGDEMGPAMRLFYKSLCGFGRTVSRLFGLGDTFEVYAVREPAFSLRMLETQVKNRGRRSSDRDDQPENTDRRRQGGPY